MFYSLQQSCIQIKWHDFAGMRRLRPRESTEVSASLALYDDQIHCGRPSLIFHHLSKELHQSLDVQTTLTVKKVHVQRKRCKTQATRPKLITRTRPHRHYREEK